MVDGRKYVGFLYSIREPQLTVVAGLEEGESIDVRKFEMFR
jgi:hypothetical protein